MNEQLLAQLERLAKLKEQGAITSQEFEQQKYALMGTTIPAVPNHVVTPTPPIQEKAKKRPVWVWVVAFFFGITVIGAIQDALKSPADIKADSLALAEQATKERVEAMKIYVEKSKLELAQPDGLRDLQIKNESWEKGGFGSVGLHSFTIYNSSKTHAYKDVKISVTYQGESGTELGSRMQVIYKTVPAGKKVRITDFNTGFIDKQAATAKVNVVEATSM